MLDALMKLASWASTSDSAVTWLLLLNLIAICVLTYWVSKYVPKHTQSMYDLMDGIKKVSVQGYDEMKHAYSDGQSAVASAIKHQAEATQNFTTVIRDLVGLLNISAKDRVGQPIILSLAGAADKIEEIRRIQDQHGETLSGVLEHLESIDKSMERLHFISGRSQHLKEL